MTHVAARTFSSFVRQGEILADLERNAARNYFRVLGACARLKSLPVNAPRPNRNLGELLTSSLERERSRIARELHAGAGQPLAGIKLNLDLLTSAFPDLPAGVQSGIARLNALADQALEQVRAVSHRLYPPDWQRLGISEALRTLAQSSGVAEKCRLDLDIETFDPEPAYEIKVTLYRCCQECLSNVLRHSGATSVKLSLRAAGALIVLRIEDDGVGFDVQGVPAPNYLSGGIGLVAMREQVSSMNGELRVQSGPSGTTLEVSLPWTQD
ncbi:MAG: sensor histidine kinase [Acidobacteriota bacterium]|nr:sensor histidine kinase [Acidobacteriota bacterium]